MTKSETYKNIINIHKKHGQGMSGIIKVLGDNAYSISNHIDELIEEGLIKACNTGGSIGHPESNIFYMPTKGYNVWEDEDPNEYSRHKGRYLQYVQFYLGVLKKDTEHFEASMNHFIRTPEVIKKYSDWLEKNHKELEIMINLDNMYEEKEIEFSESELKWIKDRGWYKNNDIVSNCFKLSKDKIDDALKIISINKELLSLYDTSAKYEKNKKDALDDIDKNEKELFLRRRLHKHFEMNDQNLKIQEIIK